MAVFNGDAANEINAAALILFILAFIVLRIWKPSPIIVMAGSGVIALILGLI